MIKWWKRFLRDFQIPLLHILFWIMYLLLLTNIIQRDGDFFQAAKQTLLFTTLHAATAYLHYYLLIPRLLLQQRYGYYFLVTLLFWFLGTIILNLSFQLLYYQDSKILLYLQTAHSLLYDALSFVDILMIAIVLRIINYRQEQQRIQHQLNQERLTSELKFLKSQINPHFLFNTLNSLYALTLQKSDNAPDMVLKLSTMLRYILYDCQTDSVTLSAEVTYLQDYIELEKMRFGDRLQIMFEQSGDLSPKIVPMLLQPFVENAIKHGVARNIRGGWVHILLSTKNEVITFEVRNNLTETAPSLVSKQPGGIGIQNVIRRLELLYPHQHELTIQDTPEEFQVKLTLF